MTNLFSSFDPYVDITIFKVSLNWLIVFMVAIIIPQLYWVSESQLTKSINNIIFSLEEELVAVFGPGMLKGNTFLFISVFLFILFSNTIGLCPFVFTSSSHMSFTLTLALPMWVGSMVWAIIHQYSSIMAHLVPQGTPGGLMPVMVMIETVSNIIRPGTLSIRLAANMVAGHLLLSLLGSQKINGSMLILVILLVSLIMLMMLELAVACIQAYVFTILSSLYLNEISSELLNKSKVLLL